MIFRQILSKQYYFAKIFKNKKDSTENLKISSVMLFCPYKSQWNHKEKKKHYQLKKKKKKPFIPYNILVPLLKEMKSYWLLNESALVSISSYYFWKESGNASCFY